MAGRLSGAILAAGSGQRLRPASGTVPKPLVELQGQPLLFRQFDLLIKLGTSPIYVIINSETHRLMQQRGLRPPDGVELLVEDTANSMESLLRLGEHIIPGYFLLMTVDAVMHAADLHSFVTNATKITANPQLRLDGALGVVRWRGDSNPLFAQITDDGIIAELGERQAAMVTAGVYLFSTAIFDHAAEARARGLDAMRRFLRMLLEKEARFAALEVPLAIDVDDPTELWAAREMLAREAAQRRFK
jgi:NDP-sugar pyrophosphorylase family protein